MSTCPTEWFDLDDRLFKWHRLRISMYACLTLLDLPLLLVPPPFAGGFLIAVVAVFGAFGPMLAKRALPSPTAILALWQILDPIVWGWHYILDVAAEPTTPLHQMKMVEGGMWVVFGFAIWIALAYQRHLFDKAHQARVAAATAARGGGPAKLAPVTLSNLPGLSPSIGAYTAGYARLGLYGVSGLIMGVWVVVSRGTPIAIYILLKALIFLVPVGVLLAVGREFMFEHMARRFDRSHAKSDGAFIAEVGLWVGVSLERERGQWVGAHIPRARSASGTSPAARQLMHFTSAPDIGAGGAHMDCGRDILGASCHAQYRGLGVQSSPPLGSRFRELR